MPNSENDEKMTCRSFQDLSYALNELPLLLALRDKDRKIVLTNRLLSEQLNEYRKINERTVSSAITGETAAATACDAVNDLRAKSIADSPSGYAPLFLKQAIPIHLDGSCFTLDVYGGVHVQSSGGNHSQNTESHYRTLFQHAMQPLVVIQNDCCVLCNSAFEHLIGHSESEMLSVPFVSFIAPEDREIFSDRCLQCVDEEAMCTVNRVHLIDAAGKPRQIEVSLLAIEWASRPAILGCLIDRSVQIQTEQSLKPFNHDFQLIFENASEAMFVIQASCFQLLNPATEKIFGYSKAELSGQSIFSFIHPHDRQQATAAYHARLLNTGRSFQYRLRIMRKDQQSVWVQSGGVAIEWESLPAIQYFLTDISEQMRAERALRASENKYRLLAEFISDVISTYNYDLKRFTYISPSVFKLRGYTPDEAGALSISETIAPEALKQLIAELPQHIRDYEATSDDAPAFVREFQQIRKDGSLVWTEVAMRLRHNEEQQLEIIGVSRDIEVRKQAARQVLYLSEHDQLTGLHNRRYYENKISRLDRAENLPLALIIADINGLKLTNDAFGHQAGDSLITRAAHLLKDHVHGGDLLARIGGDEFILLLPKTSERQTANRVTSIRKQMAARQTDDQVILSVSLGWTIKTDDFQQMHSLFSEAERRMYQHKLEEGNQMRRQTIHRVVQLFNQTLPEEQAHGNRVSKLCEKMGKRLNMHATDLHQLKLAGMLHDLGKFQIDHHILRQHEPLSEEQRNQIRQHSENGYQLLKLSIDYMTIASSVLCHHERMDGKGYPRGLKGSQIPFFAKIIAIAEAYDAMTAGTYRVNCSKEKAFAELRLQAGSQFDSTLVELFIACMREQNEG
ncbi:MAG: PAS domain S-box protein [Sporolactobacillus sp.]